MCRCSLVAIVNIHLVFHFSFHLKKSKSEKRCWGFRNTDRSSIFNGKSTQRIVRVIIPDLGGIQTKIVFIKLSFNWEISDYCRVRERRGNRRENRSTKCVGLFQRHRVTRVDVTYCAIGSHIPTNFHHQESTKQLDIGLGSERGYWHHTILSPTLIIWAKNTGAG